MVSVNTTVERVPVHTAPEVNLELEQALEKNLAFYALHPERIGDRLAELDREWDIERTLEANAATVSLLGLGMAVFGRRSFLVLPVAVSVFLLQHAVQGWCPPLPLFRRMGYRTQHEIERERYALKAIRGDFSDLPKQIEGDDRARVLRVLERVGKA